MRTYWKKISFCIHRYIWSFCSLIIYMHMEYSVLMNYFFQNWQYLTKWMCFMPWTIVQGENSNLLWGAKKIMKLKTNIVRKDVDVSRNWVYDIIYFRFFQCSNCSCYVIYIDLMRMCSVLCYYSNTQRTVFCYNCNTFYTNVQC